MIEVVEIAAGDEARTWPVMAQLRPHLTEAGYMEAVTRMRGSEGVRLAAATINGEVAGVAGFRVMEMLYSGRFLSIDDLVTDSRRRSQGVGKALLDCLRPEARRQGCDQNHLDSRLIRLDAHRFYEREGFEKIAYHFIGQA